MNPDVVVESGGTHRAVTSEGPGTTIGTAVLMVQVALEPEVTRVEPSDSSDVSTTPPPVAYGVLNIAGYALGVLGSRFADAE
jgi:hypothetical protein